MPCLRGVAEELADVVELGAGGELRERERAVAQDGRLEAFGDLDRLLEWSATCAPEFSHLVGVGGDATLSASASAAVRLSMPFDE